MQHVWNPFSRRSTKALAAVLEEMMVYAPADNSKLQASDTGWQNVSVAHLPFDCLLVVMSSRHSKTSSQLYIRLDKHFECLNLYFTCCSQRSDTLLRAGGAQWLQGDLWHPAAVKDTGLS